MSRAPGLQPGSDGRPRCWWGLRPPLYEAYHDHEWGRPVADDRRLFEKICLEGFQSGLSWLTILKKRPAFRLAFADFAFEVLARWGEAEVNELLENAGIVRHRRKIEATLGNAQAACAMVESEGSLARFLWQFEPPASERPTEMRRDTVVATTPSSERLSRELKRRGWRFVGPTTAYAFMQAMGMVNDHLEGCCVRGEVQAEREGFVVPR